MSQDKPFDQVKAYADIMKGVTATGHCEPLVFALLSFLIFGQQGPGVLITWYGAEDLDCKENLHIMGETTGLSKALEKRAAWHKELEEWGDRVLVAPDGFMLVNPRIPLHVVPRIEEILQIKVSMSIFNPVDGHATFALGPEPRSERKLRAFPWIYGRPFDGVKFDEAYLIRMLNAKREVFDELTEATFEDMSKLAFESGQNRPNLKPLSRFLFRDGHFDELYMPSVERKRWEDIIKDGGKFQMGVDFGGKEPTFSYMPVVPEAGRMHRANLSGPGSPNGAQIEGAEPYKQFAEDEAYHGWGSPGIFDAIRAGAEAKGEDCGEYASTTGREVDGARMARCREDINEFIAYMRTSPRPQHGAEWQSNIESFRHALIAPKRGDGLTSELLYRVVFDLGRNTKLRVKLLCASDAAAREKVGWVRTYIQSEKFRDVFPGVEIDSSAAGDTSNALFLKNRLNGATPSVQGVGVLSTWAGSRADLLVCDSVVNKQNSQTAEKREAVRRALFETWFALVSATGKVIFGNTPTHQEDALHKLAYYGNFEIWWDKTQWIDTDSPLGSGVSSTAWGTDDVRKSLQVLEVRRTRARVQTELNAFHLANPFDVTPPGKGVDIPVTGGFGGEPIGRVTRLDSDGSATLEIFAGTEEAAMILQAASPSISVVFEPASPVSLLLDSVGQNLRAGDTLHYGNACYRVESVAHYTYARSPRRWVDVRVWKGIKLYGSDRVFRIDDLTESMDGGKLDAIKRGELYVWKAGDTIPRNQGVEFNLEVGDKIFRRYSPKGQDERERYVRVVALNLYEFYTDDDDEEDETITTWEHFDREIAKGRITKIGRPCGAVKWENLKA